MFLSDGTKVNAVDTMTELWSGKPPQALCPAIKDLKAERSTQLNPGETLKIRLTATDPASRPLRVRWIVQPEQTKTLTAGKEEQLLPELQSAIKSSDANGCEIIAPRSAGAYRVFAYVHNETGASVGNIPFRVSVSTSQTKPAASAVAANRSE